MAYEYCWWSVSPVSTHVPVPPVTDAAPSRKRWMSTGRACRRRRERIGQERARSSAWYVSLSRHARGRRCFMSTTKIASMSPMMIRPEKRDNYPGPGVRCALSNGRCRTRPAQRVERVGDVDDPDPAVNIYDRQRPLHEDVVDDRGLRRIPPPSEDGGERSQNFSVFGVGRSRRWSRVPSVAVVAALCVPAPE